MFSSGLGAGQLDAFTQGRSGRGFIRTENHELSYVGLDLGRSRKLKVEEYCLRNRDATSHCLMNWDLEGSNDGGYSWEVLSCNMCLNHDTGE